MLADEKVEENGMTTCLRTVVLNPWVSIPLGVAYQISCLSDTYITIHNDSKITVMK